MAGLHALMHEVSAFIYILIDLRFKPKRKKNSYCFEILLLEFYLTSVSSHLVPPSSLGIGIELALWHCAQQAHSPLCPSLILLFLLGLASH